MPPRNERVAAMVQRELMKNPQVANDVLLGKAVSLDRGIRRLSARQFHATYRLPALRSVSAQAKSGTGRAAAESTAKTAPSAPETAMPVSAQRPATPEQPANAAPTPATPTPAPAESTSKALARPHAAERETVRRISCNSWHARRSPPRTARRSFGCSIASTRRGAHPAPVRPLVAVRSAVGTQFGILERRRRPGAQARAGLRPPAQSAIGAGVGDWRFSCGCGGVARRRH